MTTIVHDADATLDPILGARVAVVGYGNQGRPWALNLRDSAAAVPVSVRADETRERATADGFATTELDAASEFDVLCILIPDDIIPSLPITPRDDALVVLRSGYTPPVVANPPARRRAGRRRERLHARVRPVRSRVRRGHGRAAHAGPGGASLLRGRHRLHHCVRRAPRRHRHGARAHAGGREGDRRPPPGRHRADRAPGGGARPRGR